MRIGIVCLSLVVMSLKPQPAPERSTISKPIQTAPSVADRFMTEFDGVIVGDRAKTAMQIRQAAEVTIASGTQDIEGTFKRNAWRMTDDPINGLPFDLIETADDLRSVAEALKAIE